MDLVQGCPQDGDGPLGPAHARQGSAEGFGDAFGDGVVGSRHAPVSVNGHRVTGPGPAGGTGQVEVDGGLGVGRAGHGLWLLRVAGLVGSMRQ